MTTEIGYYAHISLRRPKKKQWDDLGNIQAWRIIKPSIGEPAADPQAWIQDWLTRAYRTGNYEPDSQPTAAGLNSIYEVRCNVSDDVVASKQGEFANDATGNDLVYIQQLFIHPVSPTNPNIDVSNNDKIIPSEIYSNRYTVFR